MPKLRVQHIFSISNLGNGQSNNSDDTDSTPQYDFCNANVENFVEKVKVVPNGDEGDTKKETEDATKVSLHKI